MVARRLAHLIVLEARGRKRSGIILAFAGDVRARLARGTARFCPLGPASSGVGVGGGDGTTDGGEGVCSVSKDRGGAGGRGLLQSERRAWKPRRMFAGGECL